MACSAAAIIIGLCHYRLIELLFALNNTKADTSIWVFGHTYSSFKSDILRYNIFDPELKRFLNNKKLSSCIRHLLYYKELGCTWDIRPVVQVSIKPNLIKSSNDFNETHTAYYTFPLSICSSLYNDLHKLFTTCHIMSEFRNTASIEVNMLKLNWRGGHP